MSLQRFLKVIRGIDFKSCCFFSFPCAVCITMYRARRLNDEAQRNLLAGSMPVMWRPYVDVDIFDCMHIIMRISYIRSIMTRVFVRGIGSEYPCTAMFNIVS